VADYVTHVAGKAVACQGVDKAQVKYPKKRGRHVLYCSCKNERRDDPEFREMNQKVMANPPPGVKICLILFALAVIVLTGSDYVVNMAL
jgi:hypothetical protein